MAQTAQIILLKDASGINISPTTNIESLYYESENNGVIQRKYIYSNFPVYVNYNNTSINNYRTVNVTKPQLDIQQNQKLVNEDNTDIIFSTLTVSRLENTNFRKIDVSNYNLSDILFNYESKSMASMLRTNINASIDNVSLNLNNFINNVSIFVHEDINSSISKLNEDIENVKSLYKDVTYYEYNDLKTLKNNNNLIAGRLYGCKYNSPEVVTVFILEALSSNTLSENVMKVVVGNSYKNLDNSSVDTDKWVVKYDFNNNKVTYMKDEWNNEAPFDFRLSAYEVSTGHFYFLYTYINNNDLKDYCLSKNVRNNKILNKKIGVGKIIVINATTNSTIIENNYIGTNNGIENNQKYTNISNCYIGDNNNNLDVSGVNIIIGNNNSSVNIQNSYNTLGDNNSSILISRTNNIIGDSNSSISINSTNNIIYNNCSSIRLNGGGTNIIYNSCESINLTNISKSIIYQGCKNITNNSGAKSNIIFGPNMQGVADSGISSNTYLTDQMIYANDFISI